MKIKQAPVGGGIKKILYTLQTVKRIGVRNAAKALGAKNTCKACALGMGGQRGGMTNELGEFPSVCNKSVQAQSTDIQPAIPREIFDHPLTDFQDLSAYEIEHLGRLATPLYKPLGANKFQPIEWGKAIALAAKKLTACAPERAFFYSSGRSSNEAGFLFQLLARAYGTNNVTNCSYYCHQATSVALQETIGTSTATVALSDLEQSDLIFVIGANPSSNHPRLIHKLKACRDRGGDVVVINPAREPGLVKFAVPKSPKSLLSGGTEIASYYLQPRIGEDLALFKGIAKAIIAAGQHDAAFVQQYTEGSAAFIEDIEAAPWAKIVERCGVSQAEIECVAQCYGRAKNVVFAWGMGMTHHLHGVQNIEYISNLALLRGMIGRVGAGLLPLRGHSNVQGIGTIGVKPVLPADVMAKIEENFGITLPLKEGMDTMACMQAAADGNIDAAVMMGGNLYASNPNSAWAKKAQGQISFKLFLTTSLNHGHVVGAEDTESLVLPVTARDEEWQSTTQESMFNYVRLSDGGITRLETVRPETTILADLGAAILPTSPIDFRAFKQHRTIREAIAHIVPGMEELADIDRTKQEFHIKNRLLYVPLFPTQSKKAHFQVRALPPVITSPFTLTTMRSEGQFNSIVYEEKDSYRGTNTRWAVLMNALDISECALEAGGTATIRSDNGEMAAVKVVAFDLPRGSVMAYYPEANALTGVAVDPRSKTPSFKSTPVWIEPVSS